MSLCGTLADTDMIADILCITRKQKCTTNISVTLSLHSKLSTKKGIMYVLLGSGALAIYDASGGRD